MPESRFEIRAMPDLRAPGTAYFTIKAKGEKGCSWVVRLDLEESEEAEGKFDLWGSVVPPNRGQEVLGILATIDVNT